MPDCPVCRGVGRHDLRDRDALMGEHLSDGSMAIFRAVGIIGSPFVDCDVCRGSGRVTEERLQEIAEEKLAFEQWIAGLPEEEDPRAS